MNNIRPDIITGTISTINAIQSLVPDAVLSVSSTANPDDGETITWTNPKVAPVTLEEIEAEKTRLLAEWTGQEYARNRLAGKVETSKEITTTVTETVTDDEGVETEVETEVKSIVVDKEAINGYPDIGDQLDDLYHAGVFSADMTAKLKKVKDDFPKPT